MDADGNISAHQSDAGEKTVGNAVVVSSSGEADQAAKADAERNAVFSNLVQEDGDIVGLVAYSIYKQNKVDWLHAFAKATGRGPTDQELSAYIIGESTPRRLATYRHLAGATLTGNGPEAAAADGAWLSNLAGLRSGAQNKQGAGWLVPSLVSYAILAAAILIGVWLVARYGLPSVRS
jgi:hypothetical protein